MRLYEGHVQFERTFDGKPYGIATTDGEMNWDVPKPAANRSAKAFRSRGWLARTVKTSRGYTVYRSQNKAAFYR